ncbi:hypothetical protein C2845_PM18G02500 [Panicum miliaceum]|uniref:RNase H type-1 domain-containing protein n=1 Tax=Panicum miliaceum TaxID=4540 RepID=A0A3L6PJJ6_PANMI|nr:hypothetical protein C2845_PM18G02500 [Panicum miliaceum]
MPQDVVSATTESRRLTEGTGEGGWGYVIRDAEGEVICAGAGKLSHLQDALHAEIRACMQGAKAAADHGMGRVILETDYCGVCNKAAHAIAELGRMCPQKIDPAWNASCIEIIVASDNAEIN